MREGGERSKNKTIWQAIARRGATQKTSRRISQRAKRARRIEWISPRRKTTGKRIIHVSSKTYGTVSTNNTILLLSSSVRFRLVLVQCRRVSLHQGGIDRARAVAVLIHVADLRADVRRSSYAIAMDVVLPVDRR